MPVPVQDYTLQNPLTNFFAAQANARENVATALQQQTVPIQLAYQQARERYYDAHANRYDAMTQLQQQKQDSQDAINAQALKLLQGSESDSSSEPSSGDFAPPKDLQDRMYRSKDNSASAEGSPGTDAPNGAPAAADPNAPRAPYVGALTSGDLQKLNIDPSNPVAAAALSNDPSAQQASQAAMASALSQASQSGPLMADNASPGSSGDATPNPSLLAAAQSPQNKPSMWGSATPSDGLTPTSTDMKQTPAQSTSGIGDAVSASKAYFDDLDLKALRLKNQLSRTSPNVHVGNIAIPNPKITQLTRQLSDLDYARQEHALRMKQDWGLAPEALAALHGKEPQVVEKVHSMVQNGDASDYGSALQMLDAQRKQAILEKDPKYQAAVKQKTLLDYINVNKQLENASGDQWNALNALKGSLEGQLTQMGALTSPQQAAAPADPLSAQFDRVRKIDALQSAGLSKVALDKEEPRDVAAARAAEVAKAKQIAVERGVHFTIPRLDDDPKNISQASALMQKWDASPIGTSFMLQHDPKDENPAIFTKQPQMVKNSDSGELVPYVPTGAEIVLGRLGKLPGAGSDIKPKNPYGVASTRVPAGSGETIENGEAVPLSALDEVRKRNAAFQAMAANKSLPSDVVNGARGLAHSVKAEALGAYDDWKTGADYFAKSSLGKWALGTND